MVGIISLSSEEMGFLMTLSGIQNLTAFPEIPSIRSEEEAEVCKNTLIEKEYFVKEDKDSLAILQEIVVMMQILRNFDGSFIVMQKTRTEVLQRFAFFFLKDMILMIERKDQYELLMLPFLPLAIGSLSNRIREFKYETTQEVAIMPPDKINRDIDIGINQDSVERVWVMAGWDRSGENDCLLSIWETNEQQVMWELSAAGVTITMPDKIDMINTCTSWMGKIHGLAMKNGRKVQEDEDGRV